MATLYNKLPVWFLKVIDAIVSVAFILIESILKILNLVSKNVFRKEIPKKQFFIIVLVHIMPNTSTTDMVSDIYLNLLGTISNINGD